MRFLTIRELRNRPGKVWERLREEGFVLTSNGKPVGVLLGVDEASLEDTLESLRRTRAQLALSRLRAQAAGAGAAGLSAGEIDAEIREVRGQRG